MNNPWVHIVRYFVVASIWAGVICFALAILFMADMTGPGPLGLGIAAFVTAAVTTGFILQPLKEESPVTPPLASASDSAKRKNDQRGLDPMSLLTEEDIEELRRDLKDSLRRRMLEGDLDDVTSFESLLNDRDQRRRR